jgi:hypothetical protein
MSGLAEVSKPLTPSRFSAEGRKMRIPARLIAVHLKARLQDRITEELVALQLPGLETARYGRSYDI